LTFDNGREFSWHEKLGGSIFGFGDMSKNNTTVAIVYDFDGTLAKGNIQENSFIPNLGVQKNYKTPTI
jgi:hypothetical protein